MAKDARCARGPVQTGYCRAGLARRCRLTTGKVTIRALAGGRAAVTRHVTECGEAAFQARRYAQTRIREQQTARVRKVSPGLESGKHSAIFIMLPSPPLGSHCMTLHDPAASSNHNLGTLAGTAATDHPIKTLTWAWWGVAEASSPVPFWTTRRTVDRQGAAYPWGDAAVDSQGAGRLYPRR